VYNQGQLIDLGTFGGEGSWAHDINDAGQVVGSFSRTRDDTPWLSSRHGYLYSDGQLIDFNTLDSSFDAGTQSLDINDAGQVIGQYTETVNPAIFYRSFLYSNGQVVKLLDLLPPHYANHSWIAVQVRAINNKGQITCWLWDGEVSHYVLITLPLTYHPPVATLDRVSVGKNSSATLLNVLANDSSPNGGTLSISKVKQPQHGTVTLNNGQVRYTPQANFEGTDVFTYTIQMSNGNTTAVTPTIATGSVIVTVGSPPSPPALPVIGKNAPVAMDGTVTTNRNTAVNVLLNATDADGDTLTYSIVSNPVRGTLSGSGANRTYTPNTGYVGRDSFSFKATDTWGVSSNTATVNITVQVPANQAPVANAGPDQMVTANGWLTSVTLNGNNSYDPDNTSSSLTYSWREGNSVVTTGVTPTAKLRTGAHTLVLKVTDPAGAWSEDSVVINVNIPASTLNASAKGSGTLPNGSTSTTGPLSVIMEAPSDDSVDSDVEAAKKAPGIKFKFSISNKKKGLTGNFSLTDPAKDKIIRVSKINAITIEGVRAVIYGVASVNGTGSHSFVLDVSDMFKAKDRFTLNLSDGYSAATEVQSGRISVRQKRK
jgi:probable HAF family extracellular repeat protein